MYFVSAIDGLLIAIFHMRIHFSALLLLVGLLPIADKAQIRDLRLGVARVLVYRDLAPSSRLFALAKPDLKVIAFSILGSNVENGRAIGARLAQSDADLAFLNESYPIVPFLDDLTARFPIQMGGGDARTGSWILWLCPLALAIAIA